MDQRSVIGSVNGHCPGSVLGNFGSFFWGLLWGPLKVVPGRFQRNYESEQVIELPDKLNPKQTPTIRLISLGPNMTYDEHLRGYLSNAFNVLVRLTSKLHETSYNNIKHNFKT